MWKARYGRCRGGNPKRVSFRRVLFRLGGRKKRIRRHHGPGGGCAGRDAAARAGGLFEKRPGEKLSGSAAAGGRFRDLHGGRGLPAQSAVAERFAKSRTKPAGSRMSPPKSVRRHHGPGGGRAGGRKKPGGGRRNRRVRATRGSCKSKAAGVPGGALRAARRQRHGALPCGMVFTTRRCRSGGKTRALRAARRHRHGALPRGGRSGMGTSRCGAGWRPFCKKAWRKTSKSAAAGKTGMRGESRIQNARAAKQTPSPCGQNTPAMRGKKNRRASILSRGNRKKNGARPRPVPASRSDQQQNEGRTSAGKQARACPVSTVNRCRT